MPKCGSKSYFSENKELNSNKPWVVHSKERGTGGKEKEGKAGEGKEKKGREGEKEKERKKRKGK